MKLLIEENENVEVITENVNGKKTLYIEGIFLQGNIQNRNKRMYEMDTLREGVRAYTDRYLTKGRAVGELNHPQTPAINLDRVSHSIISLKENGNNFIGKAKILTSLPMGKIAAGLYQEGVKLGVSSRGVGSLIPTDKGYSVVGKDFMLSTAADIVHDPSAPDAFVEGVMEGVEWIYDASNNSWLIEKTRKKINKLIETRQYQEKKLNLFNDFLNSL